MTEADGSRRSSTLGAIACWGRKHKQALALTLFLLAAFYTRSWEGDLHGDPVHYAAISKNILATGDWLTMHETPDAIYANKPPLMLWLTALNFRVLGVNTYTAKFWSAMFAVWSGLVTYLIGKRLFGPTAGLLAGAMVGAMPGVVPNAIDLRLDSAVMLSAVAAAYAVVRALDEDRPVWLLVAGLAGGLGMMAKPAALVHVVGLTLLLLAIRRRRWLLHPWLFAAVGLGAIIAGPWHLAMAVRHSQSFTGTYFGEQIGSRMVLGSHILGNVGRNAGALLVLSLPWWPLGAYALAKWRRAEPGQRWGMLVAIVWVAEVAITMAVAPRRYDRYMVPAYPGIALLAGYGLSRLLAERLRAMAPAFLAGAAAVQMAILALLPIQVHTYSCKGFADLRPLIDHLAPGTSLAIYDPEYPAGPSSLSGQWSIRSKVWYYLDRRLVSYARPEELPAEPGAFVIAKAKHVAGLAEHGHETLATLDGEYWLLRRRPAPAAR